MKKVKKFLSVLSAIAVMAVGGMSVSAERSYGLVDFDNIILSIKNDATMNEYYKYFELLIDKEGNINIASASSGGIAVKMKDGFEPPKDFKKIIDNDGSKFINEITVEECSKYQKTMIKNHNNGSSWGTLGNVTDIELTDDIYIIRGFRNGYKGATEYCEELIKSGTVEFAEPVVNASYSVAVPDSYLEPLKKMGVEIDNFDENKFIFSLSFENAEQAESFDISGIEGVEENLLVKQVVDSKIYFQFKENISAVDMGNALNTLQNAEAVKNIDFLNWSVWENAVATVEGIPSYKQGDVNYSHSIDLLDVINISKHVIGTKKLDDMQQLLADVNDDGKVDLLDAIGVAKMLLK